MKRHELRLSAVLAPSSLVPSILLSFQLLNSVVFVCGVDKVRILVANAQLPPVYHYLLHF